MNFAMIGILTLVIFFFVAIRGILRLYVRCPANKILAVQGKVGKGRSVTCYHGGATVVWPIIQQAQFLDLIPITLSIPLKGALSQQNIRVNVPSTFTIAIDTNPENMTNAAVRLLDLARDDIELMATEIIFGQLRLTIASLTIEEINQDRERFLESIRNNVAPELRKIGLALLNVNITDITDESGYIDSIGKKAAAVAINQAKIDVAEESKRGDIGAAQAERERRIKVAQYNAEAVEGENKAKGEIAAHNAALAEREAESRQRGSVADQKAQVEIQSARAEAEEKRLVAEQVVPREIEKRKVEIDAEAAAEKMRREASGEASAIIAVRSAEAEGIQKILAAKAQGYTGLVDACNDDAREAATMLMVEKIEDVVKLQVEAIKNIKIDKVSVWDSGNGEGGSTAGFLSGLVKSLPPLHDVARMAGVELPAYLGEVVERAPVAKINGAAKADGGRES